MARPDPILDSEAFTNALGKVFLSNRQAYKATVFYFIHGMTFQEISTEMKLHRNTVARLVTQAKEVIKKELADHRPELLDISALREKQAEDLARSEVEEVNRRFPFVDPTAPIRGSS